VCARAFADGVSWLPLHAQPCLKKAQQHISKEHHPQNMQFLCIYTRYSLMIISLKKSQNLE
jgi:hypothetical protein